MTTELPHPNAALARRVLAAIERSPAPDEAAALARGRPAELAVGLLAGVAEADQPEPWLRPRLRELRRLRSRQRRLAQDALFAAIRHRDLIAHVASSAPEDLWTGALVLVAGLATPPGFEGLLRADLLDTWAEGAEAGEVLALAGGLPTFLAEHLVADRGLDEAEELVVALLGRAPTTLRANPARCSRERLARRLATEGVETTPARFAPLALHLVGTANLVGTRAYRDGWFEVQDEASQLGAALVHPTPGLVVDLCCGAGGKALALELHPDAHVVGFDVRRHALEAAAKRARRARRRLDLRHLRAGQAPDLPADSAAVVLVDAPCTGTGSLRRAPTRRWSVTRETLAAAVAEQDRLLDHAADLLAPGGQLVYLTCSLLARENEQRVEALLARRPDLHLEPLDAPEVSDGTYLRVAPHRQGCDGFFGAVLVASEG